MTSKIALTSSEISLTRGALDRPANCRPRTLGRSKAPFPVDPAGAGFVRDGEVAHRVACMIQVADS